jgi:hypothetical protein
MIISFEIKLIIIDDTVYLNYKDRNEILVSGPIVYIKRKRDIASYKRINSEHSRMSSGQTSLEQMVRTPVVDVIPTHGAPVTTDKCKYFDRLIIVARRHSSFSSWEFINGSWMM